MPEPLIDWSRVDIGRVFRRVKPMSPELTRRISLALAFHRRAAHAPRFSCPPAQWPADVQVSPRDIRR